MVAGARAATCEQVAATPCQYKGRFHLRAVPGQARAWPAPWAGTRVNAYRGRRAISVTACYEVPGGWRVQCMSRAAACIAGKQPGPAIWGARKKQGSVRAAGELIGLGSIHSLADDGPAGWASG